MWNRKELKENAKIRFKANYWLSVLSALILAIAIGAAGGASGKINTNNISDLTSSRMAAKSDFGKAAEEIKDAAEDVKEAINDIDEDDKFDTHITVNGQEVLGITGSGLNEENKEDVNDAIDSITDSIVDLFSSPEEVMQNVMPIALPIIALALIISIFAIAVGLAIDIFLKNPLEAGGRKFFMDNHTEKGTISAFAYAFKNSYMNIVKTMFFKELYTFLWTLLFVIPGIIKSYEYRMIPYLLAEDPGMDCQTAFDKSKEMMDGQKWNAFVLDLSFIGWNLLSILTCGILNIFYVNPYKYQTDAELYYALKNNGNNDTFSETQEYASYVEVE